MERFTADVAGIGPRQEGAGRSGEQQPDEASGASELEKAFGGGRGAGAPASGDRGARDESGATDLEKDFLK